MNNTTLPTEGFLGCSQLFTIDV